MSYTEKLNEIRSNIHRDIVIESTVKNCIHNDGGGVLQLKHPVNIDEDTIGYVCCDTGLLLSLDGDTIIRYQDLSIEDLAVLHTEIVLSKQYSFTYLTALV